VLPSLSHRNPVPSGGAGVGILRDLAAHSAHWEDFTLKKGRKAWFRLDDDLEVPLGVDPSTSR
jgi:hypothetical protein